MTDPEPIDAATYREEVDRSIRFTGADVDTFAEIKAVELVSLVKRRVGDPSTIAALDVGAGVGTTDQYLQGRFRELHGIDVDRESIEVASRRNPDAQYQVYDGRSLPYDDGRFDLVFAICVVHHVPPNDRLAFATELARVARPGGLVAILEHNPWNPLTRLAVSRCRFDEGVVLAKVSEVRDLLESAQVAVAEQRFISFLPSASPFAMAVASRLRRVPLGAQYVVAGTRRG